MHEPLTSRNVVSKLGWAVTSQAQGSLARLDAAIPSLGWKDGLSQGKAAAQYKKRGWQLHKLGISELDSALSPANS